MNCVVRSVPRLRLQSRSLLVGSSLFRHYSSTQVVTPLQEYDRKVKDGSLRDDAHQRTIIESLSALHKTLVHYEPKPVKTPSIDDQVGWKAKLFGSFKNSAPVKIEEVGKDNPRGIYLYGDVGCGKTMLMDLFYSTVPPHLTKKRIHFHQFMQYVHKRSHELVLELSSAVGGKEIDPIPFLAKEIAEDARLLCFDEFQVTDVADAMILRRLMTTLFSDDCGVVLFATSNRHPDDLYINGVQRQTFIPCIELIKNRTQVVYLNSPTDYRKIPRPVSEVYYYPKEGLKYSSAECQLARKTHEDDWYNYFAQVPDELVEKAKEAHDIVYDLKLSTWGREVNVPKSTAPRVAQFTFHQLCGEARSAGDYLAMTQHFKSFIITDIPYLSVTRRDEVRRFITFLDAVYDNYGKLATTAADKFTNLFVESSELLNDYEKKPTIDSKKEDKLYEQDELVQKHGFSKEVVKGAQIFALDEERFAFARALSRLSQMSSTDWVNK